MRFSQSTQIDVAIGLTKRMFDNDCIIVATAAVLARSRGLDTSTNAAQPESVSTIEAE